MDAIAADWPPARFAGIRKMPPRASCPRTKGGRWGIGQLSALSFHETKNIIAGEGGALIANDPGMLDRAEIVRV
jgi:hypothetical protein